MRTMNLKNLIKYLRNYNPELSDTELLFNFQFEYEDKEAFMERFINEYLFRNIGFETVDMFQHFLMVRVRELAPHYNRLYGLVSELEVELERGGKQIVTNEHDETEKQTSSFSGKSMSVGVDKKLAYDSPYIDPFGSVKLDVLWDKLDNALRNTNDNSGSDRKDTDRNTLGKTITESIDKPLHEALEDLRKVRIDITKEFISELGRLFSLIYY